MLEEVEVRNGLRQRCCMAPVLFNLYTCLAVERWWVRVEPTERVSIIIKYKQTKHCTEGILRTVTTERQQSVNC